MFCYQCEQTANGTGCDKSGVCGKKPDVAALQDLLVHLLKGLSEVALQADKAQDVELGRFVSKAVFSTLTNVDFDPERLVELIGQTVRLRDDIKAGLDVSPGGPADMVPASDVEGMVAQGGGPTALPTTRSWTRTSRP